MASLSTDLFYEILRHLDGPSLASAACSCSALRSISREERLWENACSSMWPSTDRQDVKTLISSIGGFRKFYADCFPLIFNKKASVYREYPDEWTEGAYYGNADELNAVSPSDFVSIVDIRYKGKTICSKVLWGIPNATGSEGWFYNCPFRVDLVAYVSGDNQLTLSVSDGLPRIPSLERERKEGKLWRELRGGLQLSWIVVNKRAKKAANLASWSALGGQRHWPTEKDYAVRFDSVLSANGVLPCGAAECVLSVKFREVRNTDSFSSDDDDQLTLGLTEVSMQLKDVEGCHISGRNSLLVLGQALSCRRSKNYGQVLESWLRCTKVQSELKDERMRSENRLDRVCILSGIALFMTFWYYVLSRK